MKIRKINVRNLNSLRGDNTMDFMAIPLAHTGLFAIIGETGAGKSTILDAITLALYGKMPRNKNVKEVLSYGAVEAIAEVEFEHDESIFQAKWSLWRSRGKIEGKVQEPKRELGRWNPHLNEFEIIAEKVREVDEKVEQVTGLDYDRFRRSVLLAQGDFAAFLDSDERERSELLEKITGTEVYSQLSKAAYERHKQERDQLDRIKFEMETLKILSEEELKTLEQDLKNIQEEVKNLKSKKTTVDAQLSELKNLEDLKQKKIKLQATIEKLEEETQQLQEDFDRLQYYEKAKVFLPELAILDNWMENLQNSSQELVKIENRLNQLQKDHESGAKQNRAVTKELELKKEEFRSMESKWLKAKDLDKTNERQEKIVQNLQTEKDTLAQEFKKASQNYENTSSHLKETQIKSENLQQWLAENQNLDRLQTNLSGILRELKDWQESKKDLDQMLSEQERQKSSLQDFDKKTAELNKELQASQKSVEKLRQQLKDIMPQNYALKESQLLELMHKDLENLSSQQNELEKLQLKNQEYQQLLNEEDTYLQELEHLRTEESILFKHLITLLQEHDENKKFLDFKSEIFEQQQLIVNYEKDREELKDGDPCPLCFSTQHPFREKEYKPFVNEARKEFEMAKKRYEKTDLKYRSLQNKQQSLVLSIEQSSNHLERQKQRILEWEANFQKQALESELGGIQLYNKDTLNQKIKENNNKLEVLKGQKSELGKILSLLEKQKELLSEKDESLRELKSEHKILLNAGLSREKQIEGQRKRVQNLEHRIGEELKHYNLSFQEEDLTSLASKLTKWRDDFQERTRKKIEIERKLGILNKELEQLSRENRKIKENLDKKEQILSLEFQNLEKGKKTRYELLGALDPDREKESFLQNLKNLEQKQEASRSALEDIKRQLDATAALHEKEKKDNQKFIAVKAEKENNLLESLKKAGISSIDSLRAINLSEDQVKAIRLRKEELEQLKIENRRLMKDTDSELNDLQSKVKEWPSREALQSQANDIDSSYSSHLKNEGALMDQLRQNATQKEAAKELVAKLDLQNKEYDRWAKLNDLIGMADGKKFRIFAQALTLEKLIFLANDHLRQLNGRYFIEKLKGDDLDLEIVDTYQANHRRSMNTLSGGERFLVSLALALGLSDLAGRHSRIRSLFIDEGFGTLDDNSLDMVLSTLENLQSSGKTIGVISHVKELKERIATQIQLLKRENGFSKLKIIGG